MELTLQSDNYSGRFSATQKNKEFPAGSEYYTYLEDNYWWEGTGIIEHNKPKESHRFLLMTSYDPYGKDKGLEECLIKIKGNWPNTKPNTIIINQKSVNDLVLKQMYEDAKRGEEKEIIPTVWPKELSYEELLDKGLVTEKETGQIRLPLYK